MIVAEVPVDRVVSLPDVAVGDLARVLAGPGDLAPLVTRAPDSCASPGAFAEAAVAELERAAVALLPAWLPGVSDGRADVGGLAAARLLAAELAVAGRYPRTFLIDLAVLALTGHRAPAAPPLRVRARELARLVAAAFGRRRTVLLVDGPGGDAVVAGAEWLVSVGGPAVWLLGTRNERLPAVRLRLALESGTLPSDSGAAGLESPAGGGSAADRGLTGGEGDAAGAGSVAEVGRPHPASTVEAALECALAKEAWAAGRRWNQDYRSNALTPAVRLDLWWPRERCVVEIDGPEHCHPVRYEQDRRRDVQLTLDGHAVLRFTNARIIHDVGAVVHQIGICVRARRRDTAEGHHHGRR
ncbi:DUF559 domain-containing protein [Paractinoplanes maris]|uniref:DUF559 domain-containing protein n=1 Tax=Paractinoplanes maris TaxID=1734446 RepID=UPI00201FE7FB|nr:DUF559 domain-containing protein [Actinoplanes maris]